MRRDLMVVAFVGLAGVCPSARAESPAVKTARKACEAGQQDECYRLADLYYKGKDRDFKKAAELFRRFCDGGKTSACLDLAQMYEDGDGVSQDEGTALALRQKVCEGGDTKLCYQLAKDDPAGAAVYFEGACNAGDSEGCYDAGLAYSRAFRGNAPDMVQAIALYQKGCDAGHVAACYNAGVALGEGKGIAKDGARAAAFYTKACEAKTTEKPRKGLEKVQPNSCYNLAILYQRGEGVKTNLTRARQFFEIACKNDVREACDHADTARTLEKHPEEAAAGIRGGIALHVMKGCDDGQAFSCRSLGETYLTGSDWLPKNPARAPEYFKRANALNTAHCDKGGKDAAFACMELSRAYEEGQGLPKDPARAAALVKKATGLSRIECDKGSLDECVTLGGAYEAGLGVPIDLARAAALYKKACDGGQQGGCTFAKELAKTK